MALAGQVHSWLSMGEVRSWLAMGEVRGWMQSRNFHHCRALSTLEWVGRTARHVLLSKMVSRTGNVMVLGRVELPCTQRGNVHPRRTADTRHAASAAVLFPDAVFSFDGALRSGTAVERAGSPSWPTGWTAVGVVLAAVVAAVDIAAAAAAAAAVQVTVAAAGAMRVTAAGAGAMRVSVAAAMGVTAAAHGGDCCCCCCCCSSRPSSWRLPERLPERLPRPRVPPPVPAPPLPA